MIDQFALCKLLKDTADVIGLDVCFHDRHEFFKLPESWRRHSCKACERIKKRKFQKCIDFDIYHVHRMMLETPSSQIITCHAGFTQIVTGVYYGNLLAGVIFAGPCWIGDKPPYSELKVVDRPWLEKRLTILDAIAQKISTMLFSRDEHNDVKQDVLFFMQSVLHEKVTLEQLADRLHLSESRTSHLLKKLFGETFPQLLNNLRVQEAARLLSTTDWPIVKIAMQTGFADQNYFSRIFRRIKKITPREYRTDTSRPL